MTTTTSTAPLASPGAAAALPITSAAVNTGTAALPVYVGAPNAAQPGLYLIGSPDFVGSFVLQRHLSGFESGDSDAPQTVLTGDGMTLDLFGAQPLAMLAGEDAATLTLTAWTSGSLTLAVVQ